MNTTSQAEDTIPSERCIPPEKGQQLIEEFTLIYFINRMAYQMIISLLEIKNVVNHISLEQKNGLKLMMLFIECIAPILKSNLPIPKGTKTFIGNKNIATNICRIRAYNSICLDTFILDLLILC